MRSHQFIIITFLFSSTTYAFEEIQITPNIPLGWESANVRDDGLVEINSDQPLFGDGSLMFATDTVTTGQDKADYQYIWQQSQSAIDFPNRTLGNVSVLNFAWYRDATSTTTAHFAPVFRLNFYDDAGTPSNTSDDKSGFFIWEAIYNGINPVPLDSWQLSDISHDFFWVFVAGQGVTPIYNATLDDWLNNNPSPNINFSTNTLIIGVNLGVGSGWNDSFLGYVDSVRISFGSIDDKLYNFEQCDYLQQFNGADVIFANSFECFKL